MGAGGGRARGPCGESSPTAREFFCWGKCRVAATFSRGGKKSAPASAGASARERWRYSAGATRLSRSSVISVGAPRRIGGPQ